jgi:hypothetical protein
MDMAKASQIAPNEPQIRSIAHRKNVIDISGRKSALRLRAPGIRRQKLGAQRTPRAVISASRRIGSLCIDQALPLPFAFGKRHVVGLPSSGRTPHKIISSVNHILERSIRTSENLTVPRF